MEKTTFYIHRDRDEDVEYYPDENYRVVTFVTQLYIMSHRLF